MDAEEDWFGVTVPYIVVFPKYEEPPSPLRSRVHIELRKRLTPRSVQLCKSKEVISSSLPFSLFPSSLLPPHFLSSFLLFMKVLIPAMLDEGNRSHFKCSG